MRGKVEGCSWGGVPGLQRTAWREWLAPVFQPLRVSCGVGHRTHGRGMGWEGSRAIWVAHGA